MPSFFQSCGVNSVTLSVRVKMLELDSTVWFPEVQSHVIL